jgi:hypothetical protein
VPAIANTSAIASVISNTSAIANTTDGTSGSDGSASDSAMGSGAESRVIIFILEGCVSLLAISLLLVS